ncbi:MAG TPA: MlaD family protein [Acetobacteraceae bacterium]|nr:MlaD family protein [Acetobacteraceae bacterium]
MSDTNTAPVLARADTRRSRRIPVIWVIPIIAIAVGAWLAWDTLSRQGPTITVTFDAAAGLQAGQSQLKFKDIVLGTVKRLDLSNDHSHVVVTIATTRQAEPLLTDRTVFWVVKPRLFAGNLSGLDTLLSGSYVGMLPGAEAGKPQRTFTGSEDPPVLQANVPGHTFSLRANRLGSISVGSPVYFRDLEVGEILGWDIADMARSVTIQAFVRAPYDRYVTSDTRFWNASGVSVKLGGAGVELQLESLRALLLGGIAFTTPDEPGTTMSADNHVFPLFQNQEAADAASYSRKIQLVSYFPGSVRGLGPGSEVTMHGLVIGHVTSVELKYDPAKDAIVVPVRYNVEPERIVGVGNKVFASTQDAVEEVLRHGLRASLESASLITGQQMVTLDFVHDAPPAPVTMEGEDFVLPTTGGGGLASLQASATTLLEQVSAIPFKQIGDNLDGILRATNSLSNDPQMRKSLADLSATLANAKELLEHIDASTSKALRQLPDITAGMEKTLTNVNKVMLSFDNGYGGNTQFSRDVERLLVQLNDAVRSIRSLADLLARHPEALIKGRSAGGME